MVTLIGNQPFGEAPGMTKSAISDGLHNIISFTHARPRYGIATVTARGHASKR
jgi:hypothetical protein